jgi:sulfite reductase beta subunit-like hemoprotein
VAALKMFNATGDRERRTRARLRHVRERMGDEAFRARLDEMFLREIHEGGPWPDAAPRRVQNSAAWSAVLVPPLGDLWPPQARALARALAGGRYLLRIGLEHELYLFGAEPAPLPPQVALWQRTLRTVACPGTTWCARGVADARAAALAVRGALAASAPLSVGASGCPNNCVHAAVADIGLTGRKMPAGDKRRDGFKLYAGGDRGAGPRLGVELHCAVPLDRVGPAAAWLVERWQAFGAPPMAEFVHARQEELREGLAQVVA